MNHGYLAYQTDLQLAHILELWLLTATSEIGHLLTSVEDVPSLQSGSNISLSEGQYEELNGIISYENFLQN